MRPLAIDLFCGAGGMSEGILQAGFHIVFSSDINEDVKKTYMNRHHQLGLIQGENTHFLQEDIRNLSGRKIRWWVSKLKVFERKKKLPEIDAIFGGPPCQGFSRAGKRDKNDPRNMLFKEYIRIVDEIAPKYVVMENVEGFLDTRLDGFMGHSGKKYNNNSLVSEILKEEFTRFKKVKYKTIGPRIVDASEFGVPQRRKRIIFIAYREDQVEPSFPIPTTLDNKVNVKQAISDLVTTRKKKSKLTKYQDESKNGRTMRIDGKPVDYKGERFNFELSRHTADIVQRFNLFKQGETRRVLHNRLMKYGVDLSNAQDLLRTSARILKRSEEELFENFLKGKIDLEMANALLTKKNSRVKLSEKEPSQTMVTLPDDYITPFEPRILTVREMARLQSFDDSFQFLGKRTTGGSRRKVEAPQYTQVGNAVPPLLAKAIALQIKKALNTKSAINTRRIFKVKNNFV